MGAAQVIQVGMGHQECRVPLEELRDPLPEGKRPQARVDHEIVTAAAQMPDVRSQELVHVRLGDDREPVVDLRDLEPLARDREAVRRHRFPLRWLSSSRLQPV